MDSLTHDNHPRMEAQPARGWFRVLFLVFLLPLLLPALLLGLLSGCGDNRAQQRAVVVLVDISGDYASEIEQVQALTNYVLADLNSGDSMAVAFIDNSSFSERNFIARTELDRRPSVATQQKRYLSGQLAEFLERFQVPSYHSDISGGVLLASEFLRESGAGERYLFLLSDLEEDLMPGMNRDMPLGLEGVEVIAVNVTRGRSDNYDPSAYQDRLSHWASRVEDSGGEWRVASDLARLERMAVLR
ncbi:hypothetical protein J2T60_001168 [Natronospira proteinivora]|uniref:VWFA domain-containing protein n=1 Tax=Natronospira proteinivora TaxID=1807133 RepID=A0ABT1GA77_9GAMM|nr:VWA domain-containing protein [Natronospira proteinivora]MCP1727203.1 hypothetical protein [Natronospira proteinivora]